ncbi:hypothetical protein BD560DRAFT_402117 [Blakeslea trispora]|nr:hypothetical protein BD560DRAFT_402117 [Blakeslea trispora]
MLGANNLPQEIHFLILNQLDTCTKSHYVSVCKNWSKPATWELYRTVKLSHIDQLNKLTVTLSSNPYLGELVISLTLKFEITTPDMLQTVIQHTPNMEAFHVRLGMTSDMFDVIAKACYTGHHWKLLHSVDFPDWRRKHDSYYKTLLSLSRSLTKIDLMVQTSYAPGPNYLLFLSRKSEFRHIKHLICHTSYPSRKRSTELKALDLTLDGFMGLESVEIRLFELEDDQAYLDKVESNQRVKQLKVNVNHMTDTLLVYLCKKFPGVRQFEFWHQSSYDCKSFRLSSLWIQMMTRFVQPMDHFQIVLHDATNQMELVSCLESQLRSGTSNTKLQYNNDPQWYSNYEASIWFERHLTTRHGKEMTLDPSLLSKAFMSKISEYLKLADSLCLYNKARERTDLSCSLSEMIAHCSTLSSLSIAHCSLETSMLRSCLNSPTTLRLDRCAVSAQAFEYLSHVFVGLKDITIVNPVLSQSFQLINMPHTSANVFTLKLNQLPNRTSFVFQIDTVDATTYYELKHQCLQSILASTFETRIQDTKVMQFKIVLKSVVKINIHCLETY